MKQVPGADLVTKSNIAVDKADSIDFPVRGRSPVVVELGARRHGDSRNRGDSHERREVRNSTC